MLETHFPRVVGDIGNAQTWPFPVLYRIVPGANAGNVVRGLSSDRLLEPFVDAAQELERAGVRVITTSCGFLIPFQHALQSRLGVPILTSSLLQAPWILAALPPRQKLGIMTIDRAALTADHLRHAGIREQDRVVIQGLDETDGHFTAQILGDRQELEVERAGQEHEDAARQLIERHPDVGAIVLECTNMPPYADHVRRATGLPVFDVTTMVRWAVMGVAGTSV
jgi:Asp/Glu/hydantoin racemase